MCSSTFILDNIENNVDELFNKYYDIKDIPEEEQTTEQKCIIEIVDEYIQYTRIKHPTLEDRIHYSKRLQDLIC